MSNVAQLRPRSKSNLIVKRYPDGTFTTGIAQPPKIDKHYKPLEGISTRTTFYGLTKVSIPDRQPDIGANPEILERISLDYQQAGNQELADYFGDRYAVEISNPDRPLQNVDDLLVDGDDLFVPPLGLSDATISHRYPPKNLKNAQRRGSKGITTKGKRMVRCCCALLEKHYSKNRLSFLTATLPAFASSDELKLICSVWHELIRQFVQELKRILIRRGYSDDMVYVTEIQEDRYMNLGEVAPHLHLIFVGKKHRFQKGYSIHYSEVRRLWERLLGNFIGRLVTCLAATRVERPRKSLQGEMSSYLSKGGEIIEKIIADEKAEFLPASWYGANNSLKALVKAETEILRGDQAEQFIDNLENMKQLGLLFYKPIIVTLSDTGRQITVGYVGWIKDEETVSAFMAA